MEEELTAVINLIKDEVSTHEKRDKLGAYLDLVQKAM